MNEPRIFVLADQALNRVVARIQDDQWDQPLPPDFQVYQTGEQRPALREVVNGHAYDDAWVPDMLAGRTMAEVGADAYKGDLLGDNPKANFASIMTRACAAAEQLDALDRPVHTSFGDFPANNYLWQITGFRALRAYDIARVIGVEPDLPEDLVQGVWDQLTPVADEWRTWGVFPAAVSVPEDAPLLDRLLGLTGRQPRAASAGVTA